MILWFSIGIRLQLLDDQRTYEKKTVKTSDHQMKINNKEDPETSNYGYIIWI